MAPRMRDEVEVKGLVYGIVVTVGRVDIEGEGCDVEADADAWRRTLIRSRGFPIKIPAAPLMYPAQKSADMVINSGDTKCGGKLTGEFCTSEVIAGS